MNIKLQKQLEKKYPSVLFTKKGADADCPYDQRGIECGDGWFDLIDNVCNLIHNRNQHTPYIEKNGIKKWYRDCIYYPYIYKLAIYTLPFKAYHRFQAIFNPIVKWVPDNKFHKTRIVRIKEKFGGLRIYLNNGNEYAYGAVDIALNLSYHICEECGTTENVTVNSKGWIKAYCKSCRTKIKKTT